MPIEKIAKILTKNKCENIAHIAARMNKVHLLDTIQSACNFDEFNYRGYQPEDYLPNRRPKNGKLYLQDEYQGARPPKKQKKNSKILRQDYDNYYDYCLIFTTETEEMTVENSPIF
jgi:hypothetical protein